MNYVRATSGRVLAIKVRNHLRRGNILSKVTTDGITMIEVFAPTAWDTAAMARTSVRDAFFACGAFDWQLDRLNITTHGWEI
jgi:hypothetical protein